MTFSAIEELKKYIANFEKDNKNIDDMNKQTYIDAHDFRMFKEDKAYNDGAIDGMKLAIKYIEREFNEKRGL